VTAHEDDFQQLEQVGSPEPAFSPVARAPYVLAGIPADEIDWMVPNKSVAGSVYSIPRIRSNHACQKNKQFGILRPLLVGRNWLEPCPGSDQFVDGGTADHGEFAAMVRCTGPFSGMKPALREGATKQRVRRPFLIGSTIAWSIRSAA
jgi:hypothetical protein